MKYKADAVPRYGLMLKYLRMILSKRELDDLIKRYVAIKKKTLTEKHPPKNGNKVH